MNFDTILTLLFFCLPIFFALICFYYAIYFLKTARNIEDSPTSKIRSAAQGYVELTGVAKPLTTPSTIGKLTQKPCAWYRYTIEVFETINTATQTQASWNLLDQGISKEAFLLDDGTGQCIIQPGDAEIMATQCNVWRGHTRIPNPPTTSFLRWLFWDSFGSYRYTEYRLEFDVPIYASGMFYTLSSENQLIENATLLKDYLKHNPFSRCNLLSKEGLARNEHYIISAVSEPHIIRQLKIKAFIFFIAFIFFSILSVHLSYYPIKNTFHDFKKYKSSIQFR